MADNKLVIVEFRFAKPSGIEDGITPGKLAQYTQEYMNLETPVRNFGFGRHRLEEIVAKAGDHPQLYGLSFTHQAILRRALDELSPFMDFHVEETKMALAELKAANEHARVLPVV